MARFDQVAPVLQGHDVSLSMRWYSDVLGLEGWAFPKSPPYEFALLSRDGIELMFQRRAGRERTEALNSGWAVYIHLKSGDLLELAAQIKKKTKLLTEQRGCHTGMSSFQSMPVTKSERAPMNPPKRGAGAGHTQGPRLWSLLSAPWSIDDDAGRSRGLASKIAASGPNGRPGRFILTSS